MIILPEILTNIIPFCELEQISNLDIALTNKIDRPYFLNILKNTTLKSSFLKKIDSTGQRNFAMWLRKRNIKFHSIDFGYDPIALTNVVCQSFETIKEISLFHTVSSEVLTLFSNLCKIVTKFKLINNTLENDIFFYLDYEFVEKLEHLELSCCSNFGLVFLQCYAKNLKYISIRNVINLNDLLVYDLVKTFPNTYINLPLQWSIETNYRILKTRNFKKFEIISFYENDVWIKNTSILDEIFVNTQIVLLIQFFRVTDIKKIIHLFYFTKRVHSLHISSNNIKNISSIVFFLQKCQTNSLYIRNTTYNINICLSKIISLFKSIINQEYSLNYLNFNIVFDDENITAEIINFSKFNKLLKIIQYVVKRRLVSDITISGLIICTDFNLKPNWKNLLYELIKY
jgi:hypothetical protein